MGWRIAVQKRLQMVGRYQLPGGVDMRDRAVVQHKCLQASVCYYFRFSPPDYLDQTLSSRYAAHNTTVSVHLTIGSNRYPHTIYAGGVLYWLCALSDGAGLTDHPVDPFTQSLQGGVVDKSVCIKGQQHSWSIMRSKTLEIRQVGQVES